MHAPAPTPESQAFMRPGARRPRGGRRGRVPDERSASPRLRRLRHAVRRPFGDAPGRGAFSPSAAPRLRRPGAPSGSNTPGCEASWDATTTSGPSRKPRSTGRSTRPAGAPAGAHRLLRAYRELAPFPEVRAALERLAAGRTLAILSNGHPDMLDAVVDHNDLRVFFGERVIRCTRRACSSPIPASTRSRPRNWASPRHASASCLRTDGCRRRQDGRLHGLLGELAKAPAERLGVAPDREVLDLAALATLLARWVPPAGSTSTKASSRFLRTAGAITITSRMKHITSSVALIGRADEDGRVAPGEQQRAPEVLLHHRAEHEAQQQGRGLAVELGEEVADEAEERRAARPSRRAGRVHRDAAAEDEDRRVEQAWGTVSSFTHTPIIGRLSTTSRKLPTHIEAIIPQKRSGLAVMIWGAGLTP